MGSKLAEASSELDVGAEDVAVIKRHRRRWILTRLAQFVMIAISALLGVIAAEVVFPVHYQYHSYPYAPIALASLTESRSFRRTWIGAIITSVALFIVAFVAVAVMNEAASGNYGVTTRYGLYSKGGSLREVMT